MKKLPYLPLYTGDWLKEPTLSVCMPATRGIWIDLLCAMHEQDQSGELRGTSVQLARLARCSTVELEEAFTDLQTSRVAELQNRSGVWTIANRRMKRAADLRGKRADAGSKGGSKTKANFLSGSPQYESEDEGLEKVREFARGEGICEADADWFFWKEHGNGWTNGGEPVRDWKATFRSWKSARYLPSLKMANGSTSNPQRQMSAFEIEKRTTAINDEINAIYRKQPMGSDSKRILTPDIRQQLDILKQRKEELKKELVK